MAEAEEEETRKVGRAAYRFGEQQAERDASGFLLSREHFTVLLAVQSRARLVFSAVRRRWRRLPGGDQEAILCCTQLSFSLRTPLALRQRERLCALHASDLLRAVSSTLSAERAGKLRSPRLLKQRPSSPFPEHRFASSRIIPAQLARQQLCVPDSERVQERGESADKPTVRDLSNPRTSGHLCGMNCSSYRILEHVPKE